jgi:hypothetical protein
VKRTAAWAALLAVYFWWFSWDSLRVKFAPDDLMNIHHYWRLTGAELARQFLAPWNGGYRPMGAAFYLPLFRWFGLEPWPYHAAMLLLLLANAWLVFRLARALGCSPTASGVAGLLACYHAGLSFLYFNTSFIYDALCAFFYLAAAGYYVAARASGRLGARDLAVFLALHFGALHSKEMAVTLPAIVLAYEVFCQKRRQWAGVFLSAALNLPFLYGVFFGRETFIGLSIYKPALSAARIFAFHRDSLADLFLSWHFFSLGWVLAVWALLTAVAWRRRHPVLRFCWCWFLITPLPLELLEGRTSACLAIPFYGLAILAGTALTDSAEWVAKRLGGRRAVFAGIVAAAMLAWAWQNARLKRDLIRPQMEGLGQETWSIIRQLRELNPRVGRESTVVFLNDPFEGFDMAFIAELWFRQPGLNIRLNRKTPFTNEELTNVEHLFSFEGGRLVQTR